MATTIKVNGTTISINGKDKGQESAVCSVENTTLFFPKLSSAETGYSKPFASIQDAMKSSPMRTLIGEIKGWISRQNKYAYATRKEAEENKQSVINAFFSYDRKTAANNARRIEYATCNGIMFVLAVIGYGSYDYIGVFCPIVNSKNQKVIFKPCGSFYTSKNETIEKNYESLILSQEALIQDLISLNMNMTM